MAHRLVYHSTLGLRVINKKKKKTAGRSHARQREAAPPAADREFCIHNLLVRIHLIIEMILVDRPCAMGV